MCVPPPKKTPVFCEKFKRTILLLCLAGTFARYLSCLLAQLYTMRCRATTILHKTMLCYYNFTQYAIVLVQLNTRSVVLVQLNTISVVLVQLNTMLC